MDLLQRFYPESRFGGYADADGTLAFYTRIQSMIASDTVVLDVGCGRGAGADDPVRARREARRFKGRARHVIGIDVDPAAATNSLIDEFRHIGAERWPIDEASIDLVVVDNVLEHIANPDDFFGNVRRVLRKRGCICLRTPNVWGYVALASRLVPNRLHARLLSRAQKQRHEADVFPTVYRCNSIPALRRMLRSHGFDAVVYGYEAQPSYLDFSKALYGLGVLHQKLAPGFLKPALFAFGQLCDSEGA